jgi:hypothetical protein
MVKNDIEKKDKKLIENFDKVNHQKIIDEILTDRKPIFDALDD